jgi:ATP-dependent protease ClpP protease subunit
MRLYGAIGPRVDGDYFAQELASLDRGDFDMIHIRMNSPGGNVFQGMSIVSAILSMNTPVCGTSRRPRGVGGRRCRRGCGPRVHDGLR